MYDFRNLLKNFYSFYTLAIVGDVVDLSCLNVRDQSRHGPYKVCVLHKTSETLCKLTHFELPKDVTLKGEMTYPACFGV